MTTRLSRLIAMLLLTTVISCQQGTSTTTLEDEDTKAAEQQEEIPFDDYSFEQFKMQFDVAIKGQPLPKAFSSKFLDGESYIPIRVLLNSGPDFVCLVSSEYAASSYVVFYLDENGKQHDKEVILYSEGGDLYHHEFRVLNDVEFALISTLDLSLYDESIEGPMTDEFRNSLPQEKTTYYTIATGEQVIKQLYSPDRNEIERELSRLSKIEQYFVHLADSLNRQSFFGSLMNHKKIRKNGMEYRGAHLEIQEVAPSAGYIKYRHGAPNIEESTTEEMVFWQLADGKTLVGKAAATCAMVCENSELQFFIDDKGSIRSVDNASIVPNLDKSIWLKDPTKEMKCDYFTTLYHLPKKGKDIVVSYESDCTCCDTRGTRLTLKWANGKFEIGEFSTN